MEQLESGDQLTIEFWGVRGSIPTAEKDKLDVGGNTPCVVIQFNQEPYVIIDGGTGLRVFGTKMCQDSPGMLRASILLSHFHWDHIQGIPFFGPIYSENAELKFYSTLGPNDLKRTLEGQMKAPYFPVPMSSAPSRREYLQVPDSGCEIGSLSIRPVRLNHPGGAFGYRIDSSAGSLIYVSDHEHGIEDIDAAIVHHANGADLLIYDSQYTPSEYLGHKGWGHSTWLEGTRLANRAQVGRLVLYHHNPFRLDGETAGILMEARKEFAETEIAREKLSIVLSKDMPRAKPADNPR
jgi:phosphoribosyl 1,2-cyclic phosphodiesterase